MSKEQRVFAHWKSFGPRCYANHLNHKHSHVEVDGYEICHRTEEQDNNIWLLLARVHRMKVREVKDIVTAERKRRAAIRNSQV